MLLTAILQRGVRAIPLFLFMLLPLQASAALRLSATTLFIDLPTRYQSVTLQNDQDEAVEVSLGVMTWPLPGLPGTGQAQALLVPYPQSAVLPPQGEQVFRLVYEGGKLEYPLAFRVLLRHRPAVRSVQQGVQVSDVAFGLGSSFPLFINPDGARPDVQITRASAAQLRLNNRGAAVAFVSTLQGAQRGQRPTSLFVLPGMSRDMMLPSDDVITSLKVERQGWLNLPVR